MDIERILAARDEVPNGLAEQAMELASERRLLSELGDMMCKDGSVIHLDQCGRDKPEDRDDSARREHLVWLRNAMTQNNNNPIYPAVKISKGIANPLAGPEGGFMVEPEVFEGLANE